MQNTPGTLSLKYIGNNAINFEAYVYTINGQLICHKETTISEKGNLVLFQLASNGIFLIHVITTNYTQTFKANGSQYLANNKIEVIGGIVRAKATVKNSTIVFSNDFSYNIGDSLRISVYKEGYYTYPESYKISTSSTLIFILDISNAENGGISDAYAVLDSTIRINSYDGTNGDVDLSYTYSAPDINVGDIITVDVDTMGYLRKVVDVVINEDSTISLETEQAYLDDIFVNANIKLNTAMYASGVQVKSAKSFENISETLTDDEGYIHPVKIIYHDSFGKKVVKDALKGEISSVPIYDIDKSLTNDLYGNSGDNIHFYIREGHLSFSADAVFEFDVEYKGELTEDTKIKKGDLKTFKFYLDSEAEFIAKLQLDMNQSSTIEKTRKLVNCDKVTAKFIVLGVPVWITFDCDIYGAYNFSADGEFHANWGFESNHIFNVGGDYDNSSDSFSPIYDYTPSNTVYPLNIDGQIGASAHLELYPRTEMKFYGVFGPYSEIVPFVNGNINAVLRSSGTETFTAWNSGVNVGLDFRVGTELTFIGLIDKEFGPVEINCFNYALWEAPYDLELASSLPNEQEGGTVITLIFAVTDNYSNEIAVCPVYVSGDGVFSNGIAITNTNGQASVEWILPEETDTASFTAAIFNADGTVIKEVSYSISVTKTIREPEVKTLEATDITDTTATLNGNVSSNGNATITDRGFYWSTSNTTPTSLDNIVMANGTKDSFDYTLTNLLARTTYYYRAYATNSKGTAYGKILSFITDSCDCETKFGSFTDSRDGHVYKTINIGDQIWMAENLAYLPYTTSTDTYSIDEPCFYVYDYYTYGVLYNWPAALCSCPSEWHLPSDDEWITLTEYLGDSGIAGGKMKSTTGWNSPNTDATNEICFSALPGGVYIWNGTYFGGDFYNAGDYGFWWSSSVRNENTAWWYILYYNDDNLIKDPNGFVRLGVSVRCVKN